MIQAYVLFVHREEDAIEFRIKTVANVGVLLPVKVVKRIVFTSMPNRSESHLLRCINPESGSRSCHFVFFLFPFPISILFNVLFSSCIIFFFGCFQIISCCLCYKLCNDFHRWSLRAVFFPIISLTMSIHIS